MKTSFEMSLNPYSQPLQGWERRRGDGEAGLCV